MEKYTLVLNEGTNKEKTLEFVIPKMTIEVHEEVLDSMVEYKKMDEEAFNRLFNKHIVLTVLKKIDKTITIDDIRQMHPSDYTELFEAIWTSGQARKSDTKFRDKDNK